MRIDRETIEQFSTGDSEAFSRIFRSCAPTLFGMVLRIVGDRALSEDVVQEAFVRLYRMRTRVEPDKPVEALLARIAANLSVDTLRKRKRERWEPLEPETPSQVPGHPIDVTIGTRDSINRATAHLAPIYRAVLTLRYGQELTYEEIAAILDISVSAVALRLKRGKEHLRQALLSDARGRDELS